MQTTTQKNRTFTTVNGNAAVVFQVRELAEQNFFQARGRAVRTYIEVAGQVLECEPGCSYQAERICREAGL